MDIEANATAHKTPDGTSSSVVVDDQYQTLASCFARIGKVGKPPKTPAVVFNNRLLLQLRTLREETGSNSPDIELFFKKLFPEQEFPSVVPLIRSAVLQFSRLSEDPQTFLDFDRNIHYVGPFSKEANITRSSLSADLPSCSPSNGLVVELAVFASKQGLKSDVLAKWISQLTGSTSSAGSTKLLSAITKAKTKATLLRRKQGKPGGQDVLNSFLCAPFLKDAQCFASAASSASPSVHSTQTQPPDPSPQTQLPDPSPQTQLPDSSLSSQSVVPQDTTSDSWISSELKKRDCELRQKEEELVQTREQATFLHGLCREKSQIIDDLTKEADKIPEFRQEINRLTEILQDVTEQIRNKEAENRGLKQSAVYKRLQRRERELRSTRKRLLQITKQDRGCIQLKVHSLQRQLSVTRNRLKQSVETKKQLKQQLKSTQQDLKRTEHVIHAAETEMPVLKDGHKFVDNVVTCTAQLIGECDIAAHSCAKVIKCVGKHIFKCDIPDSELPSKSSALRFADVAHVIAKMHTGEEMSLKAYDLHCDGTSRSREKFVGQQITLADRTVLSLGFQLVAREDAQSLLDLTLHVLDEMCYLNIDQQGEDQLKAMLRNMVGIMSDRAAVMKSFQDATEAKKKEILQTEEGITRLYCNAHFLLGLSAGASKALTSVEKARGLVKGLGRDCLPAFARFASGEPAAVRVIRLACDVLGPRGDEKNGCRDDWMAFCALRGITSKLNSFRSNRFNNLFESAAALIHHADDIKLFFTTYKEPTNLKQQSILHDMRSPQLSAMVAALAVCYIFVTGPFWQLVRSETHYLDQGLYIQRMFANICGAKDFASVPEMLDRHPTALQGFGLPQSQVLDRVHVFVNTLPADLASILTECMLSLMEEFAATTQRQLKQFLAGGEYSAPATPEQRQKMSHCKLNNLFGEACLGDLDFSLFKRRHSSVHHHSTVNMLKRNKPISNYLMKKSEAEQQIILSFARNKAAPLREQHRDQEKAVVQERQQYLLEQQAKGERLTAMRERRKMDAVRAVQQQGGLCLDRASVEQILLPCRTKTAKFSALSVQLIYHRTVLGSSSKLLNKTKLALDQIKENLIQYLESMLCCRCHKCFLHFLRLVMGRV